MQPPGSSSPDRWAAETAAYRRGRSWIYRALGLMGDRSPARTGKIFRWRDDATPGKSRPAPPTAQLDWGQAFP